MKRLMIALLAMLFAVLGPTNSAFAGDAGGSTGADGTGSGSGSSVGGGAPPATGYQPGSNVGSMNYGDASQFDEYYTYENRSNCNPDYYNQWAPGTNYYFHYKNQNVNGTVRKVLVSEGCMVDQSSSQIVEYEHKCVVSHSITVRQTAPAPAKFIGGTPATKTTPWGSGTKTVAACDQSRVSKFSLSVPVKDMGQYQAVGTSRVDTLWVKRYTNGTQADEYHDHAFSHNTGNFDTKYTMTCDNRWVVGSWVAYSGLPGCATPPLTEPVPGDPGGTTSTPGNPGTGGTNPGGSATPSTASYQCSVNDTSTIDAKNSPIVDIMRDGDDHALSFSESRPEDKVPGSGAVKNVVAKNTVFEIWNAPKVDGAWNGNTFDLKRGNKSLIDDRYGANADGMGKSNSLNGTVRNGLKLEVYKSTARNSPMKITPAYTYTADVEYERVDVNIDIITGQSTYTKVTDVRNEEITCRGDTITTNVMKAMNDSL